jgi:hypothetical protein
MNTTDGELRPWQPPPAAPDAETNVARWALGNRCSSATALAAVYLALSGAPHAAIPFSRMTIGLDAIRTQWLLDALADRVNGKWLGTFVMEVVEAYPDLADAARAGSVAFSDRLER